MSTLAKQLEPYIHRYVRKGGKQNRKQQMTRLLIFINWQQQHEQITGLEQLGKRHVILFWKHHRHQQDATAYHYWLAIRILWEWLNKATPPPKPLHMTELNHLKNDPKPP